MGAGGREGLRVGEGRLPRCPFAALCRAGWNALIKVGLDPLSTTTLIAIGSAVVALVCLPAAGMPAAAWPWLIVSAFVHVIYFAALLIVAGLVLIRLH